MAITINPSNQTITQYNIQTGGASNLLNNVAPSSTSGVPVISQGASSQPIFGTAVVAGGGTGQTSLDAYALICGGTTDTGALQTVAGGTSGTLLQAAGDALPAYTTATYPGASVGTGKILYDNGTNFVTSTPTFPASSSATSRTMMVSNGTNWVASTETWAVPGTSGNVLTSNGTNWTSVTPAASSLTTILDAGSSTWTANAKTKWVKLFMWSGGAGGGSGRKGTQAASGGGGGGSAGGTAVFEGPVSMFSGTISYTVASSAGGGLAQASDANNGNPGTVGNSTIFGGITVAGGAFGPGGTTGGVAGGVGNGNLALQSPPTNGFGGSPSGGTGRITTGLIGGITGGNGAATYNSYMSPTGGGGGGGSNTGAAQIGGTGGTLVDYNSVILIAGGTAGISSGTINGGNGNPPLTTIGIMSGGTGGGGGGGAVGGATGGTGGDGAVPGGGGGGGGGGISAQASSGAGGAGAAGRIIIIEYF